MAEYINSFDGVADKSDGAASAAGSSSVGSAAPCAKYGELVTLGQIARHIQKISAAATKDDLKQLKIQLNQYKGPLQDLLTSCSRGLTDLQRSLLTVGKKPPPVPSMANVTADPHDKPQTFAIMWEPANTHGVQVNAWKVGEQPPDDIVEVVAAGEIMATPVLLTDFASHVNIKEFLGASLHTSIMGGKARMIAALGEGSGRGQQAIKATSVLDKLSDCVLSAVGFEIQQDVKLSTTIDEVEKARCN